MTVTARDLAHVIDALAPGDLLHAEDLHPGDRLELGEVSVSTEQIMSFAAIYDPLSLHVDPEAAAAGPFGEVIASAVHTLALYSSLASRRLFPHLALVAGKGIDRMRVPAPVRPDRRLRARFEVLDVAAGRSPAHADVRGRSTMVDDTDSPVLVFEAIQVVRRRHTP